MQEDKWICTEEAAAYLGVHRNTIRKLVNEGGLPAYKVNREWRYKKSMIDEWMKKSKVKEGEENS